MEWRYFPEAAVNLGKQKEVFMKQTISERLGCSTITFRHQTLSEALDRIVAAGLKKVDIACIPGFCHHINPLEISKQEEQDLQGLLHALGLTVSTLNVSAGGLNTNRKDLVYRYIEAAIHLGARLGCYAITIPTGSKVSNTELWEENALSSAQLIRELAECAAGKGIRVTLEAPHPGTLAENIADTRRFFDILQDERVACTFDTSHVARGNLIPVAKCISEIGAEIGHVHLRDCIGENNHLTPGKGNIDFQGVLHELQQINYAGDLILELEGEDNQLSTTELAFAIRYMSGFEA